MNARELAGEKFTSACRGVLVVLGAGRHRQRNAESEGHDERPDDSTSAAHVSLLAMGW